MIGMMSPRHKTREPSPCLKKTTIFLIPVIIVCLILTGCSRGLSEANRQWIADITAQRAAEQAAYEEFNAPIRSAKEFLIEENLDRIIVNDLEQPVRFTKDNYINLRAFTDGLVTHYPYAELYHLDEALERYYSLKHISTPRELTLLSSLPISGNELHKLVKRNNDAFFASDEMTASWHKPLDDDYLLWVCEVLADAINSEFSHRNFDRSLLYDFEYRLENLRIVHPFKVTLGSVSPDGLMTIVAENRFIAGITADQTAAHELMHLIQLRSNEALEASGLTRFYGFTFAADDLEINSLVWSWFLDAAAERLAADLFDSKARTYKNAVKHLDTLTMTRLLSADTHVQALPRLTQQPYLEEVFNIFDLDTPKRQMEFLCMMYALEIVLDIAPGLFMEEFWAIYEDNVIKREPDENDQLDLRRRMNGAIFTTMSKLFYENLAENLVQYAIPLHDIFELIIIYEASINDILRYTDRERNEPRQQFFVDYSSIKEKFFMQIAEVLEITAHELLDDYDSFNVQTEALPPPNLLRPRTEFLVHIDYSWLDADKNAFLTRMYDEVMENKTISIRQMADIWQGLSE